MPRGEDSDATAVQESIVGSGNVTMKPFAGWDSNPSVPVPTAPVGGPGSQQAAAMAVHDAVQQASLMTQPIPMHHSMIMGTTILKPLCWVCGKDVSVPSKPQGRPLCDLYESVRAKIPAPVEPGSKRLCSKHYNMISSSMSAIDSVLWAAARATDNAGGTGPPRSSSQECTCTLLDSVGEPTRGTLEPLDSGRVPMREKSVSWRTPLQRTGQREGKADMESVAGQGQHRQERWIEDTRRYGRDG